MNKIILFLPFLLPLFLSCFAFFMIIHSKQLIDKILSFLTFGLTGIVFFWLIIASYTLLNVVVLSAIVLTVMKVISIIAVIAYLILLFAFKKLTAK